MKDSEGIRERADRATPGPWTVRPFAGDYMLLFGTDGERTPQVAALSSDNKESDAEFIAHAREDIPFLLDRLRLVRYQRDNAQATANDRLIGWDETKAALKRYGRHEYECGSMQSEVAPWEYVPCTCGSMSHAHEISCERAVSFRHEEPKWSRRPRKPCTCGFEPNPVAYTNVTEYDWVMADEY